MIYNDGLEADKLLVAVASCLKRSGYNVGGVVQSNPHPSGRRKCDMDLTDLLTNERIRISYNRGDEARGCRLDPDAFARATVWVEHALAMHVDLMIINKFGKQEAQGRGLRSVVAEALLSEIPVLLGVSRHNLAACEDFVGAILTRLPNDEKDVLAWCTKGVRAVA